MITKNQRAQNKIMNGELMSKYYMYMTSVHILFMILLMVQKGKTLKYIFQR